MKLALRKGSDWEATLRDQLPHLQVRSRRFTGVGFFTNFECPPEIAAARIPQASGDHPVRNYPPTINARRTKPRNGLVSFIVWVNAEGRIRQLEACSLTDDQWPENPFEGFVDFQDDNGAIVADQSDQVR